MFAPPWWRHGGQPCKKVVGRARAHHLVSLIPGRRPKKKMGHFPGPIRSDMPIGHAAQGRGNGIDLGSGAHTHVTHVCDHP